MYLHVLTASTFAQSRKYYASTLRASILFAILALVTSASLAAPILNGIATHSHVGKAPFYAGLYTESIDIDRETLLENKKNESIKMELKIRSNTVSKRRFKRLWREKIGINSDTSELEKHSKNLKKFESFLHIDLKRNDVFSLTLKNNHIDVTLNDVKLGRITDRHFYPLLLRSWLGPVPPSSKFRAALLQQRNIDDELFSAYHQIYPNDARKSEVANALVSLKQAKRASIVVKGPSLKQLQEKERKEKALQAKKVQAKRAYLSTLRGWTQQHLIYSKSAQAHKKEGVVNLQVTIARDGQVTNVKIQKKSEYGRLNNSAIKTVEQASPYPAVPKEIANARFTFTTPVVYSLSASN
ncbi:MAG: hypothetical protein COA42_13505 [Alteromonadaceae bacterium]|nr:MAG: hypothetical protein COA42_13505 [Alteromonadaceae bacterium]